MEADLLTARWWVSRKGLVELIGVFVEDNPHPPGHSDLCGNMKFLTEVNPR